MKLLSILLLLAVSLGNIQGAPEDNIYLLISDQNNTIYYSGLKEVNQKEVQLDGDPRRLISGLNKPTYLEYDFRNKVLYFCNQGAKKIEGAKIAYQERGGISAEEKFTVMEGIDCGDIKLDKFGYLYYVSKDKRYIGQIDPSKLQGTWSGTLATEQKVYSEESTRTINQPEGLAIEREYVYWTNIANGERYGAVHKGFTVPFHKAIPFQTYQIADITQSFSIAANSECIFFTASTGPSRRSLQTNETSSEAEDSNEEIRNDSGSSNTTSNVSSDSNNTETIPNEKTAYVAPTQLYMMKKDRPTYYYNISDTFQTPRTILPLRDQKVLVADSETLVVIDTSEFPPDPAPQKHSKVELKNIRQPFGLAFASLREQNVRDVSASYYKVVSALSFAVCQLTLLAF